MCLTRDEVEAFLVFNAWFNLTGEQVEPGRRFIRLIEKESGEKSSVNRSIHGNKNFL